MFINAWCYNASMSSTTKIFRTVVLTGIGFLACIILIACSPAVEDQTPIVTSTPPPVTATPPEPSEQPSQDLQTFTIWIPPLLAPDTQAGSLLAEHLASFQNAYALINIEIRIKEESGPSGILETLSSASLVAPSTLPDIILLDPTDLNTAALKSLIEPLDQLFPTPNTPEWYAFAINAAFVDGIFYGLPFFSEGEAFAYRKESFEVEPKNWADLLGSEQTMLFPLGDQTSKFTLIQYISTGGKLVDDKGSPTVEPDLLTDLLKFYSSANQTGQLPLYALQLKEAEDTWLALAQGNTNAAVIPVEALQEALTGESYLVAPWPTRDGSGVTPTRTYSWAVVVKDDLQQDHISQVLQWLSEPTFQGQTSQLLGMIPVTPTALQEWSDPESSAILSRLIRVAAPEPNAEEIATFGPLLWQAVEDVLNERSTPEIAAENISNQVQIP
jgi:ABC-type glycerol-3-phosphate transport system substrate-binding protein